MRWSSTGHPGLSAAAGRNQERRGEILGAAMTVHHAGPHGGSAVDLLLPAAVLALAAVYLLLAAARRREPRGWSHGRTISFLTGCALLLLAVVPALSPFPEGDLRGHMHQHLLLAMYAPLGLVLGAPITLLLRTVRASHGRRLTRALRWPLIQFVTHPITAVILNLGGLAALYLTPLYVATAGNPAPAPSRTRSLPRRGLLVRLGDRRARSRTPPTQRSHPPCRAGSGDPRTRNFGPADVRGRSGQHPGQRPGPPRGRRPDVLRRRHRRAPARHGHAVHLAPPTRSAIRSIRRVAPDHRS